VNDLADALAAGRETDLAGAELPAADLVALLTAPAPAGAPALRLRRATITGALRLSGARVGVPVELRECTFGHAPDLRMAELTGLALTGSRLPGLRAGNLRVAADLLLDDGFDAGPVDLTDAQIGGSLRLSAGRPRAGCTADRVVVEGTCYARRLRADDEVRLPGARIMAAARVGTFTDSEELWAAEGGVAVDGFDYQTVDDTRITDTRRRLHLLEQATGDYAPGPYEQLAAAYRRAGHEDLAERVLMTRQVRRVAALDGRVRLSALVGGVLAGAGVAARGGVVRRARADPGRRRPAPRLRPLDLRRRHPPPDREPRAGRLLAFGGRVAVDRDRARRGRVDFGDDGCGGCRSDPQTGVAGPH
jgi:hypothetical protein